MGADYERLVREADVLLDKHMTIGIAVVLGDIDPSVCRELQATVGRLADYVSYARWGPVVVVVFQRCLFEQLMPLWQDLLVNAPGICAGVAFSGKCGNAHELLLASRLALMRAIALHNDLVAFEGDEAAAEVSDYRLACDMKRELDAGAHNFDAHFQPQVMLASGLPVGAEALARWCKDGKPLTADRFIPIAERAGLIGRIGEIMLARSARVMASLRRAGVAIPCFAVNVSPSQMQCKDFLRTALDIVKHEGLAAQDIELEITESIVGNSGKEFLRWIAELREAGFGIAIDDFGTGASTLARIREIPAGKIKLDRAFVLPLPEDAQGRKICHAALRLTHSLGMISLAEGVETRAQARFLKSCGCAQGQGYFWGRPMPADELAGWWRCRAGESITAGKRPAASNLAPAGSIGIRKGERIMNRDQYLAKRQWLHGDPPREADDPDFARREDVATAAGAYDFPAAVSSLEKELLLHKLFGDVPGHPGELSS